MAAVAESAWVLLGVAVVTTVLAYLFVCGGHVLLALWKSYESGVEILTVIESGMGHVRVWPSLGASHADVS